MVDFVEVAKASELEERTMRAVEVQGTKVLLVRSGGRYYAINNRCPHLGGNLSQGHLKGTVVTCPVHGSQFDITDGHVIRWLEGSGLLQAIGKVLKRPRPVATYNVKIVDDKILVEMRAFSNNPFPDTSQFISVALT